nr:histone deacetylase [Actinomycetota bacterium]
FCLLNNVAVTAASLAGAGERVLVVDIDAHHGNGTQDAFWDDPRVAFVSLHQWPLYPGTGPLEDVGEGDGEGYAINLPVPPGSGHDTWLSLVEHVVVPAACAFEPELVLVSAGFDAHRADPLTGLGLSSGDYADLTARLAAVVAPGRVVAFLEGGYDLDALGNSAAACVAALAGERLTPEPVTNGGPGREVVRAARIVHDIAVDGDA